MNESNKENKAKKARSAGQRIRDIKRLLENKKFQISEEKRLELEEEAKALKDRISKNNSSNKKKLNKYLQYKKNRQKTMRFVELVKVKRKINQLQKLLVEILRNNEIEEEINGLDQLEGNSKECLDLSFSENDTVRDKVLKIKSKLLVYKRYQDYIRLLPFFKERKYIPLFSNTELDSELIKRREEYIKDVQELREELRRKKIKTSEIDSMPLKDSFLAQNESNGSECDQNLNKKHDSLKGAVKKIEYVIGGNQTRNTSHKKKSSNKINVKDKNKYKDKSNLNKYPPISESETNTKIKPSNSHVIFSDSD
ncbi:rRNA-processing protein Efg1 [Cryptosporidium meleagridis]